MCEELAACPDQVGKTFSGLRFQLPQAGSYDPAERDRGFFAWKKAYRKVFGNAITARRFVASPAATRAVARQNDFDPDLGPNYARAVDGARITTRMGWKLPYVSVLHSHSAGPNRKRRSHHTLSGNCRP